MIWVLCENKASISKYINVQSFIILTDDLSVINHPGQKLLQHISKESFDDDPTSAMLGLIKQARCRSQYNLQISSEKSFKCTDFNSWFANKPP